VLALPAAQDLFTATITSPRMLPTKTGRHDNNIAEIVLKVVLKHQKSNQSRMLKGTFKVNNNLINKVILIYIIIHFIYF
jgi:hypothetical protein